MPSQFSWCTETLLTFIANIRLHTFMSTYVILQLRFVGEFLLTNVTSEPSSFIVWLQHLNVSELCWHENCFVAAWTRIWDIRSPVVLNSFPQKGNDTVFCCCVYDVCATPSCCWGRSFCYKLNSCAACLQCGLSCEQFAYYADWMPCDMLHMYGFSPLWILLCILRLPAWANSFSQTGHSNGFSPEWVRLCIVKAVLL